jgi:undecaprenyl-diphosphatase
MNWFQGIALGLLQGITEILPISSDGHLALLLQYWQLPEATHLNLSAALHLGTALAILIFMFSKVKNTVRDLIAPNPEIRKEAWRLILMIVIGSIPVVTVGLLLENIVEKIFNRLTLVSLLFIINGTILLTTYFACPKKRRITPAMAFLIGLIQASAILPAISRSGTTISLALLLGVSATDAFEFSFLIALPVTIGAAIFELLKIDFSVLAPGPVIAGIIVAGLSGYLMLISLRRLVFRQQLYWFGIYCWALGLLTFIIFR